MRRRGTTIRIKYPPAPRERARPHTFATFPAAMAAAGRALQRGNCKRALEAAKKATEVALDRKQTRAAAKLIIKVSRCYRGARSR